jgi:2-methylcitrate dehydratase PrpD
MGFFSAACRNKVDHELLRFGRPFFFATPGIAIKLYPCAGVLHPTLDVVLELVRRHDIEARDVKQVRVALHEAAARPLVYDRPSDGLQAKFSLPFAVAVALIDRQAGLEQFTSRRLRDPGLRRLINRVEPARSSRQSTDVEITLRDGRRFSATAVIARGHPRQPASRPEIENKFRSCAAGVLHPAKIETFPEQFWSAPATGSAGRWLQALRPARA